MRRIEVIGMQPAARAQLGQALMANGMALHDPAEPGASAPLVRVFDGRDLRTAEVDAALPCEGRPDLPVIVLFRLEPGQTFRGRRDALLSQGAADVMEAAGSEADLVTRIRALCTLSEPPRVLVVDDDPVILNWAAEELEAAGLRTDRAATLAEAWARFRAGPVDALVVDRQLPDGDGVDFIARLRAARIATPALIYTAMTGIADRVEGLERARAEDYLCKPAHADELRARVRVLLRPRLQDDQIIIGPLDLSRRDRVVRWRGARVEMRPRETDMLIYLAERAGVSIPQQMLYLDIWEKMHMDPGSNPVAATKHRLVSNLRKFTESCGETCPDFIEAADNAYILRPELLLTLDGPACGAAGR